MASVAGDTGTYGREENKQWPLLEGGEIAGGGQQRVANA